MGENNMRRLSLFVLFAVAVTAGCGKSESRRSFQKRQKVETAITSNFDTTHREIVRLAEESQSFRLVSQPAAENSGPESMTFRRGWVLASRDQSPSAEKTASLIKALEALGKPYSLPQSGTELEHKYDFHVKDEGESIRVDIVATWSKE
jgi:hypothetical protein